MGLEEVSETIDLPASKCHLELCKPNMKDASASGKESYMKTNGQKRTFALLLCVMMIVSSMSVWAAEAELGGGGLYATCGIYVNRSSGSARTTPLDSGNSYLCRTTLRLCNYGNDNSLGSGSGTTDVSVNAYSSGSVDYGVSTHYIGTYYTSLTQGV